MSINNDKYKDLINALTQHRNLFNEKIKTLNVAVLENSTEKFLSFHISIDRRLLIYQMDFKEIDEKSCFAVIDELNKTAIEEDENFKSLGNAEPYSDEGKYTIIFSDNIYS